MNGVLNLQRLELGSSRHTFKLTESELQLDSPDIVDFVGCDVTLDVDRQMDEFIVRGKADVDLKLECVRCLEPFGFKIVKSFVLVIKVTHRGEVMGPDSDSSDDYFVVSDSTEQFDIAPIVRERIILSLPMKPLCDKNCKGLCPKCGINRNFQECDCTDDDFDERWEKLLKLKESDRGN